MKVYLVGGAVRDELLGLEVTERDWVVVGATVDDMLAQGYEQVGKAFPVFLHPTTHEEYALARTEKKSGQGYYGFICDFSPEVTLEEDLKRRDLTINAIAKDESGELIDPYGGLDDLNAKKLKHVSQAFIEDPVRVLRVARFMARFEPHGFAVDPETMRFMQAMVNSGEVDHLVAERSFNELKRALSLASPVSFIRTLRACGALKVIMPELDALYGVPQRADYHPEIDTGIHIEMVLEAATKLSDDPEVRFAAMLHDLGKGTTPDDILPRHIGHEGRSVELIKVLCKRLKVPASFRDLAVYVGQYHGQAHQAFDLKPSTVIKLFESIDAYRRPARFEQFLCACHADYIGRKGFENKPYLQADYLREAFAASMDIDVKSIVAEYEKGEQIKQKIHQARVSAIKNIVKNSD